MKKIIFLFAIVLAVTQVDAQDKKFGFGFLINPNLSDNFIYEPNSIAAGVFGNLEKPKWSYSAFIFTDYGRSARSKLRVGLGYSNSGYQTDKIKTNSATPSPLEPEYTKFTWTHHDILIPILYKLRVKESWKNSYLVFGISPLIKVSRRQRLESWYASGEKKSQDAADLSTNFKLFNFNATLGWSYAFKISHAYTGFIQPTFDCNILEISRQAIVNRRIYSFGISFGVFVD